MKTNKDVEIPNELREILIKHKLETNIWENNNIWICSTLEERDNCRANNKPYWDSNYYISLTSSNNTVDLYDEDFNLIMKNIPYKVLNEWLESVRLGEF